MAEENTKDKLDLTQSNPENATLLPGQNISSSSSVKLRKSSNIFSALVRKARRKKTSSKIENDGVKNLHISSQNLSGSSTFSLAAHIEEEVELNSENYENKNVQIQEVLWKGRTICSETNTSNHSEISSTKTGVNMLNLRATHSHNDIFKEDSGQITYSQNHQFEARENKLADEHLNGSSQGEIVISSFINFGKPTLEVTYAEALQYLQEVINSFHESENHVINLLAKYITDPNVHMEMTNAISNHAKLQWEAERRSCSLANDIWMQQIEIGRAQEKILQGTLHSLVKQNRMLQIENENLYRKYEKTNKLTRGFVDHKHRYQECDSQIDSVLRHNEKLQAKLESVFKKIDSLECELHILQKQNDNMEEQIRNSTIKTQNMKATFNNMKTDYEIQQVALNFKLDAKEQVVKEAVEAGDIVLEDLESLKRQFKNLPFALNWSKFKVRGNCLTDLIHLCRSCINELSKELVNVHTEITLKEKDIIALRESNKNVQERFKSSLNELNIMSKKNEENSTVIKEKYLLETRCQMLEDELKTYEEKIKKAKAHYEGEKSNLLQNYVDYDKHIKEVEEKDKMIEQIKLFVANITSENYSLQNEIATLNRIIKETGAGDNVREKEYTQQQLEMSREEVKKLTNENSQLKDQLKHGQNESHALLTNHEMTHKTMQRQVKELERLNGDNQSLRQILETERQTVLSLQNERMKYLEEKGILKSIIQHLKGDLSKIRKLEDTLSNVTKEASRLKLIAEYSKKHGDKLKEEVVERNNMIAQLKTSMQKFNEIQMKHEREKMSLCFELNEMNQVKKKLSEVLDTEVKKNAMLGQSKEAILKSVNSQIEKFEEKHKNERAAMKVLLRDIKIAAEQKDNAIKEKSKLEMETEQLKIKMAEMDEKYINVTKELTMRNEELKEILKNVNRYEKLHKEDTEKFDNETTKYELNVKLLKKLIQQLRDDKKSLENSNECLKNSIEKLHKDLDECKESEQSTVDTFKQLEREHDKAKQVITEQNQAVKDLLKEREKFSEDKRQLIGEKNHLMKEVECLNALMDKVVHDFEASIKTAEEKENMFKEELSETKRILFDYGKEIQDLKQHIELKEKRIEELKEIANMDERSDKLLNKLKAEANQLERECFNLKEDKINLEIQLANLKDNYDKLKCHAGNLEKESEIFESQLKNVLEKNEEDYVFYKKHIASISRSHEEQDEQYKKEIFELRLHLQDLSSKLDNEKTSYETLSQIHKDVSGKFMRSIKDLVDVKNSRQEISDQSREYKIKLDNMENEKKELNIIVKDLSDKLEKSNNQIRQLNEENTIIQKDYDTALEKCTSLENQIEYMEIDHHRRNKDILNKTKDDDSLQAEIVRLRNELEEKLSTIHRLKMEISDHQKQIALLQIERSEITLQLHDTERKLETEKNLAEQLKNTQKLILAAVIQLRDDGKVDAGDCIHLLHMVRSSGDLPVDASRSDTDN